MPKIDLTGQLGCQLEAPDERDYMYDVIAGGAADLPESFSVESVPHFYQNGIDACVGMALAAAKSVQEGEKLSPRVIWGLAKKRQNYDGWGTSVSTAMTALIEDGTLQFGIVDEEVLGVDREDYMRPPLTEDMMRIAEGYKIKSYWRAGYGARDIQALKVAIYNEKLPLITSMEWKPSYNFPKKGFLPEPDPSEQGLGHCYVMKGWFVDRYGREVLHFQNSFRSEWGLDGDFFILSRDLDKYNMRSFYVLTDIESDKASILARYNGQLIRNADHPAHYFVSAGKIAWIKNEESFFFGRDSRFWGGWADTKVVDADLQSMYDLIF